MKSRIVMILIALMTAMSVNAKKYPQMTFEKTTIDVGEFSVEDPVRVATFKFTNTGKKNLIINYAHASCGCTSVEYPKDPISPGATGEIKVTYNGFGKMTGKFKKTVTLRSNCKADVSRIFITGDMIDVPVSKK
ncbi:MAG: DUF1573 domain-containing protein [Bacteroidaceae bacterium]|nr:DUF1573 domain-containing protein [Bacteroidaceae bacterium]MBR6196866.1 DUF1573 domain-containing protein [Bacteroidaceae bacterium]